VLKSSHYIFVAALLCILAVSLGCDYVDAVIVIHLHAVVSSDHHPLNNAAIWLRDRRFAERSQPQALRTPICITDDKGICTAEVRYGYGYSSFHWRHYLWPQQPTLQGRFVVAVTKEEQELARQVLPTLSASQVQGVAEVNVAIEIPPGSPLAPLPFGKN